MGGWVRGLTEVAEEEEVVGHVLYGLVREAYHHPCSHLKPNAFEFVQAGQAGGKGVGGWVELGVQQGRGGFDAEEVPMGRWVGG